MQQTTLFGGRVPPKKKQRRNSTDGAAAGRTLSGAAAGRSGAGAGAASRTASSSFVECPVCGKHILLVSSDDHVVQCLTAQSTAEDEAKVDAAQEMGWTDSGVQNQAQCTGGEGAPQPSRVDRSSLAAPPEQQPAAAAASPPTELTAAPAAAPLAAAPAPPTVAAAAAAAAAIAAAAPVPAGESVLNAMMKSARESTEKQQFSLTTTGMDATNWELRWSWTPVGGSSNNAATDPAHQWEGKFKSNPKKGPEAGKDLTIQLSATTAAEGGDDGVGFVRALAGALAVESRARTPAVCICLREVWVFVERSLLVTAHAVAEPAKERFAEERAALAPR